MNNGINTLALSAVSKHFMHESHVISVLDDISILFERGVSYAVCGFSGSGKSTMLRLIGCIDDPTAGQVVLDGKSLRSFSCQERERLRTCFLGFVFQDPRLIQELSVLDNVILKSLWTGGSSYRMLVQEGCALLDRVGLYEKRMHRPSTLSGGQQQRVALARALFAKPSFLIADEPTGSLDERTGSMIFDVLLEYQREWNMGFIISTHDHMIASQVQNMFFLRDGKLI
jgi:ABC-type lipoprotein export system ATPase subunit